MTDVVDPHPALDPMLDPKVPSGPMAERWSTYKFDAKLVNPANKRRYEIIMVGTGLAGAAGAATLAELGYKVKAFTFHDSPRRAHSIAAQGGINAAKNYRGDGDSIYRLFYDTVKGGDFRSRESNVYRLAEVSGNIIDQCVAQGVPFAREYGGLLDNRSFGGSQVSRTFYARGQTGQQLLLGAYQALARRSASATSSSSPAASSSTSWSSTACAPGSSPGPADRRDHLALGPRPCWPPVGTPTCSSCRRTPWAATPPRPGAPTGGGLLRQPVLHADPPHLHPAERRVPVEAHADVGVAAQRRPHLGAQGCRRRPPAEPDPRGRTATTTSSGCTRASATSLLGTSPAGPPSERSTAARRRAAEERGVPRLRRRHRPRRPARHRGALREPLRDVRAHHRRGPLPRADAHLSRPHYTMGGLWVDYELMTTVPGLYAAGEANFSDHGANRLGASALMQGLADGYFVLPGTMGNYLAPARHQARAHRSPGVPGRRAGGSSPVRRLPGHRRDAVRRLVPPRARQDHVGLLRDGAHRGGAGEGAGGDPGPPRGVPQGPARAGWFRCQPVAGEGGRASTTSSSWRR